MDTDAKIVEALDHFTAGCEDLIFVVNRADRIEYCNSSMLKLLGSERNEAMETAPADFAPGSPPFLKECCSDEEGFFRDEAMDKSIRSVFESGKPVALMNDMAVSGRGICLDVRLSPIGNGDKTVRAVLGIARDISEQKQREQLIAHSRREWLQAVDGMPYPLAVVGPNHRIERLNIAMADMLGSTVRDAIGFTCYEALHGTSEPPSFCPLLNGRRPKAASSQITAHLPDDNFLCTISPVRDRAGKTVGCIYLARRISESDRSADVKRSGEEYMRMFLKGSDHSVYIQNPDGKYVYFSAMPGDRVPWGLIGSSPFEFFEPCLASKIVGRVKEVAAQGTELAHEVDFSWGGEVLRFFDRISPVRDAMGRIKAVMTVSTKAAEFRQFEGQTPVLKPGPKSLTSREREVLRLIAGGLTSSQVAEALSISRKTVETHRTRIMRKLDLHKTSALVGYAARTGLI